MSKFYMFSGSSAVGKTTTLNEVMDKVDIRELTARTVRAEFGNPCWDEIMLSREMADKFQVAQLTYFLQRLNAAADQIYMMAEDSQPVVFERSPWDVVGYSLAFCCSVEVIEQQKEMILDFEDNLLARGIDSYLVKFTIDTNYEYELIPARPPANIRLATDYYLQQLWNMSRLKVITRSDFLTQI